MMRTCKDGASAFRCSIIAVFFAATLAVAQPPPARVVREGVAVDFAIQPAAANAVAPPWAGDAARIRFSITDTTTGAPLRGLRPAAWLSRRHDLPGARPRTCQEKVQELLGGSIFSKAELDLNSFQVLALNDDATITVVDPLFGFGGTKLLAMIALPGVGLDWTMTPDGRRLFVTVPSTGNVVAIDTADWTVAATLDVGASPGRIALQPDGHYVWAMGEGGVTVIAAERSEVVKRIATGGGPHEIAFSANNRWAFVINRGDHTLAVIDIRTLGKTENMPLGCAPDAAVYSRLSDAVYLTDPVGGEILVFDATKHAVVARVAAEPGVSEMRFAPGGRFALVAVPERDLVLVFDAATNRVVQRAHVERGPEQFAFSSDMAFVRRRGSSSVGMIPLKELGREGQAVPVAEFSGGESAFGARASLADSIVQAPGETAVVVANPGDEAIYYYMEGMAAPMGNFGNYDRQPRAVLVRDRSLREVAPGVYETAADLPAAGEYDVVFFLDSPRITHCFATEIAGDGGVAASPQAARARLELAAPVALAAGSPARLVFRVAGGEVPPDLVLLAVLSPGVWHARRAVVPAGEGTVAFEFNPPKPGLYSFHAESPALGLAFNGPPVLVLTVPAAP